MVDEEDIVGNSQAPSQLSGSRRMYWRSASWSASRTGLQNPENEQNCVGGPSCIDVNFNGQNRRHPAVPLTPRSQQISKARACLPPLQPLSITRRSLDEWPKAGSDDIGEWPLPPTPGANKNSERLKLDLSVVQQKNDNKSFQLTREKIAFFDKKCSKVAEHIYLGGDSVARDKDILKQNGITHILNCVGFVCPEYFKSEFFYRTLWLQDSPSEDITSILYDVFDYFEDVREQNGKIFVHCCQGVSRSTSLVIAYLMWREGQSFEDAFQYVKAARGIADPNMGFACQLLQCQKRVHAVPLSPSSLLRMFRISPHSPYDPLHLVPKMLNDPSPSALDSRGAFIIHIPSAIYIWIGTKCEAFMERDARLAVCQIVRYEKVQGPIAVIKEAEEPVYFWDAFANFLPLMDKSGNKHESKNSTVKDCPGLKTVEEYNVDFEIFQKAISGGFVPPFASSNNEHETCLPARESSWSALRWKFASGVMKESILATKKPLSRVYSESMMIVRASPASTLSSSSSSPAYLSPNSICSDSSTCSQNVSESSMNSPLTPACSIQASSLTHNFSNLSLSPSKSAHHVTNTQDNNGVNRPPQMQSRSSACRPSLAERRGSLSKCLKLPGTTDADRGKTDATYTICQRDSIEIVFGSKERPSSRDGKSIQNSNMKSPKEASHINLPSKDNASVINDCGQTSNASREPSSVALAESDGCILGDCRLTDPFACHWPSMEKVMKFSRRDLDPKSAIVIVSPSKGVGQTEGRVLHFWLGRLFHLDRANLKLDSNGGLCDTDGEDWAQVGFNVLSKLGLPKDTPVKIIRESEETTEFLALLSSL